MRFGNSKDHYFWNVLNNNHTPSFLCWKSDYHTLKSIIYFDPQIEGKIMINFSVLSFNFELKVLSILMISILYRTYLIPNLGTWDQVQIGCYIFRNSNDLSCGSKHIVSDENQWVALLSILYDKLSPWSLTWYFECCNHNILD